MGDDENLVCRLKKALYGLKQAPRAWYEELDKHIRQQGFKKGSTDNNLYIKFEGDHFLIIDVYVDHIIFGSDLEEMGQNFAQEMQKYFEMLMVGELTFFLGLQVIQNEKSIFISQSKYIKEKLK